MGLTVVGGARSKVLRLTVVCQAMARSKVSQEVGLTVVGRARSKVLRMTDCDSSGSGHGQVKGVSGGGDDSSGWGHGQVNGFSGGGDDSCGLGHGQVNGWAATVRVASNGC